MVTKRKYGPAITWERLAQIYNKRTGGKAFTRSMESVFDWAVEQKDIFYFNEEEGTLHEWRLS